MASEMRAEIARINGAIETLDDPRECYALVVKQIHEYRQSGSVVPEDLTLIERCLMGECMAASQGR